MYPQQQGSALFLSRGIIIYTHTPKGIVFFFPGNSLPTHSLDFRFFFSTFWRKKNTSCFFFFFQEKSESHPLGSAATHLGKQVFFHFFGVFFFQHKSAKMCIYFFFPWKSLLLTHSLVFMGRKKKKKQNWKKNTPFSLTHSIFP